MANRTAKGALHVRGTNPQHLIEKVVRSRIYDSIFWKEHCFALTAESLVPVAADLKYVGGTYGGAVKPSEYLCLVCKLLQLQPEKEIILEYLKADDLKYLRAVAAMYVRMVFSSVEVYEILEPLLNDYHKLRWRDLDGSYRLTHMDVFIDELLTQDRVADLILPRLARRDVVEETEGLAPRRSKLEDALLGSRTEESSAQLGYQSGEESDDSVRERLRERRKKEERASDVRRRKREEQTQVDGTAQDEEEHEEETYASQEDDSDVERYVSRSPSRSVSPDRAGAGTAGYVSRSPSRTPSRQMSVDGYVSRSPSRSPDR